MNKVSFIVFIDDFGDDILARDPKSPYGLFVCRQEDVDTLNDDLVKNYISQKIHLREGERGKRELFETVEKISSFLKNCKKKFMEVVLFIQIQVRGQKLENSILILQDIIEYEMI